jgi:hypothetical protein
MLVLTWEDMVTRRHDIMQGLQSFITMHLEWLIIAQYLSCFLGIRTTGTITTDIIHNDLIIAGETIMDGATEVIMAIVDMCTNAVTAN